MTAAEREPPDPRAGRPATDDDGSPGSGPPRATGASRNVIDGEFAAAQEAGLLAMISLADAGSRPGPPASASPATQGPGPLASASGEATSSTPPRPEPVNNLAPLIEQARAPQGAAHPTTGDPPPPLAQQTREPAAGRASPGPGHLRLALLIAVLTLQAVLSLRLVWGNTAGSDEATYLWAGHLEIAHWLHSTPVPPFQTWLAGSPVFYPPIAAAASSIGGLAGARILSLVFMAGATALLWGVTSKLFGGRAAFYATTMFAILAPTQFLGAMATYDAMALLLVAVSAWCIVAARDHSDSTVLLVAGAVALALANAARYGTVLFDPIIVALAALVISHKRGAKPALGRAGYLAASVTAIAAALLALGGPLYLAGVMSTTLARSAGSTPAPLVLGQAWKWVGVVWLVAWIGVIISLRRSDRGQALLLAVLALAGLLALLDQAGLRTLNSLDAQADVGAWLAVPAAGFALAKLSRVSKRSLISLPAAAAIGAALFVPVCALAAAQARSLSDGWHSSYSAVAALRGLTRKHPGNYLAEDYNVLAYYLESTVPAQHWSGTWNFSYTPPGSRHPLTGTAAYRSAITRHYFSMIILDFGETLATDRDITADLHRADGYQLVAVVPSPFGQYTVWAYQAHAQPEQRNGHR